nr:MAG TPA: hypothetical protein [Caudoviricetes sp.]
MNDCILSGTNLSMFIKRFLTRTKCYCNMFP